MKIVLPGGSGAARDGPRARASRRGARSGRARPLAAPGAVARRGLGRRDARPVGERDGRRDVVINLTGRSVNCRYTPANRREILESRVLSTRVVGEAIARAARPPRTWLQMSSATIYAHRFDAPNDEATGRIGGDEPGGRAVGIQRRRGRARGRPSSRRPTCRHAKGRAALVDRDESGQGRHLRHAARPRAPASGAPSGDGRQMVSWIHEADFVRVIHWLIAHEEFAGVVNLVSPGAVPNAEFMKRFRRAAGAPFGLPAAGSCSSSARGSSGPSPSSCSRAGGRIRGGCSPAASRSSTRSGTKRWSTSAGGGARSWTSSRWPFSSPARATPRWRGARSAASDRPSAARRSCNAAA